MSPLRSRITDEMIEDIFAPGGLLEEKTASWEERPDQLQMAKDVARCYNESGIAVIEAGTGIGKSYAYLASAILAGRDDKQRTVVATSNTALQRQLVDKDLPTLIDALGEGVPYSLLLGRAHYACIRAVLSYTKKARGEGDELFKDTASIEERVFRWASNTESGIVDEMDLDLLRSAFVKEIRSDKDRCLKQRCPHFSHCFYYKAAEKATKSRIVVTNHALLLIDAAMRAAGEEEYSEQALLPPFNHLVIDECHNIDRAATEYFSAELGGRQMEEVYNKLYRGGDMCLADRVAEIRGGVRKEDAEALRATLRSFIDLARALLVNIIQREDVERFSSQCLIDETVRSFDAEIAPTLESLLPMIEEVCRLMEGLRPIILPNELDNEDLVRLNIFRSLFDDVRGMAAVIEGFLDHEAHPDQVFWYSYESDGSDVVMHASPLSVGPLLRHMIFDKLESVVCTSATLKTGKDFSFFLKQTGLDDKDDLVTGFYPSPFDYASKALLLYPICQEAVDFNTKKKDEYADYLASLIPPLVESSGGGALVLFTSREMLEKVWSRTKDLVKLPMLKQGRGVNTGELVKTFRSSGDAVLYGLQSFWEGVDIQGDALRLLIITQLPFQNISDCVMKARKRAIARQTGNEWASFREIDLPLMLMRLKQGLGRLIRSQDDRGVALIADGRMGRRYAQTVLSCIPPFARPDDEGQVLSGYPDKVERFLFS